MQSDQAIDNWVFTSENGEIAELLLSKSDWKLLEQMEQILKVGHQFIRPPICEFNVMTAGVCKSDTFNVC